ncbi:conserved Plasmodium protein, unknown function [Plasmodium ovale wallikeri]|uniref:Uncharacterized protein n=2 Tax=Plasmodium ovale TaxID=36330 RepID=A0A1A8ZLW8_PLAOA|nr:conserved Plasmodium protein, unknown function [Plasmodium ovale wallikeri]SBT45222.1 conserved Plasmodium protein, unknown function [Plasmodium ovale wallikeri]SBT78721.1 conserved Plasmodium protein, unknown function [Plasmodium ovale]
MKVSGGGTYYYSLLEKEINNKVNTILNCILYNKHNNLYSQCRNMYRKDIKHSTWSVVDDRKYDTRDRIDETKNCTLRKWRYYDKMCIDLLKEYVKLVLRSKRNSNMLLSANRDQVGEHIYTVDHGRRGKEEIYAYQRKNEENIHKNEKKNEKIEDTSSECHNVTMLHRAQMVKEQNGLFIDRLNFAEEDICLKSIKFLWLKHVVIIFKLLIEDNLRVDDKRKFAMTTAVVKVLKSGGGGMQGNSVLWNNCLLVSCHLLATINMIDRELLLLICRRMEKVYKSLSHLNKYYLFTCVHNYSFISKKFQQMVKYVSSYFYNLLKDKYLRKDGQQIEGRKREKMQQTNDGETTTTKEEENITNIANNKLAFSSVYSLRRREEYFPPFDNYLQHIFYIMFKGKKFISQRDRALFKCAMDDDLQKGNKINCKYFRTIINMCDKDLRLFLFHNIVNSLEFYDNAEMYSILTLLTKCEDEYLSDFVHILKETSSFERMNIKHVASLYILINRILKKEMKRRRRSSLRWNGDSKTGNNVGGITSTEYASLYEELSHKAFHLDILLNESEKNFAEETKLDNDDVVNAVKGKIELVKSINELLLPILTKKKNYLNSNTIVTLLYNTCPIEEEEQVVFVYNLLLQLYEENRLGINFVNIYDVLFRNFCFYLEEERNNGTVGVYTICNNGQKESISSMSIYENKVKRIFHHIRRRFYVNEETIYNVSRYTIVLNILAKFVLHIFTHCLHKNDEERELLQIKMTSLIIRLYTHLHFIFDARGEATFQGNQMELVLNYSRRIVDSLGEYVDAIIHSEGVASALGSHNPMDMSKNGSAHMFAMVLYGKSNEDATTISSGDKRMCTGGEIPNKKESPQLVCSSSCNYGNSYVKSFLHIMQYIAYVCSFIHLTKGEEEGINIKENMKYIYMRMLKYDNQNGHLSNSIFGIPKNGISIPPIITPMKN